MWHGHFVRVHGQDALATRGGPIKRETLHNSTQPGLGDAHESALMGCICDSVQRFVSG